MPKSKNPTKAARQAANLTPLTGPPPGNRHAQRHGGRARPNPQRQAQLEAQIAAALPVRDPRSGDAPAHDAIAVRLLAISLCRLETCARYVTEHGMFDRSGRVRPAAEHEQVLIQRVSNQLDKLGMSPRSRAALGLDLARTQLDLAQLMSDAAPKPPVIEGTAHDA